MIPTRQPLRDRRANVTQAVAWQSPSGPDTKLIVTFGLDRQGKVKEAFCSGFRAGTDICALANDACVMMSLLLQSGMDIADVSAACGEDKPVEDKTPGAGPPASLLGAIAREGIKVQDSLYAKHAATMWNRENK